MKQLFSQLKDIWSSGTPAQRMLSVLGILVVLVGLGGSVYLSTRPDFALLFGNLDPSDAASVVEEVRGAGVDAEVRDGGRSVFVPREHRSEMRMLVSAAGLPRGNGSGWELFEQSSFGVSNFVQNVTYRRALQGALARDIASFDAVEKASVNVTQAKRSPFVGDDQPSKASVIVHTRSGRKLSEENVLAITHFISGAVEGLEASAVHVMDSQGHVLTSGGDDPINGSATTLQQFSLAQEDHRRSKGQQVLVDAGLKGYVQVHVESEMQQKLQTSETQAKGTVLSEKIESRSLKPSAGAAGGPVGTESKITDGLSTATGGMVGEEKDETIDTEYAPSRTVTSEETSGPRITHVGVALTLHTDHLDQRSEIESMVKAAVGFEDDRGDSFTSMVLEFEVPEVQFPLEDEGGASTLLPMILERVLQVLGILGALFLVLKVLKTAENRAEDAALAAGADEAEVAEGEAVTDLAAQESLAGQEAEVEDEPETLPDVVRGSVENDPAAAARVLRSWLHEGSMN